MSHRIIHNEDLILAEWQQQVQLECQLLLLKFELPLELFVMLHASYAFDLN
jgi:hypothetical protein